MLEVEQDEVEDINLRKSQSSSPETARPSHESDDGALLKLALHKHEDLNEVEYHQ